jgi:transposase
MAKRYRPVDREQSFLLPPDMREWLAEDHLAWLVLAVVAELDTSAFHARPGRSWAGRARFDPDMMLALLVYAYANQVLSSRRIEALCAVDVAFRVICAGDAPDHATLARFRRKNLAAFEDLFAQVLVLCAKAGMARVGTVAIDGTKVAANASGDANRSEDWLRAQAADLAAAAEATDADEDDLFGPDRRGDEVPDDLVDPSTRAERIQTLLRRAEADQTERDTAAAGRDNAAREYVGKAREGRPRRGRPPAAADPVEVARARVDRETRRAHAARATWQARAEAAAQNGQSMRGRRPAADPAQAPAVRRAAEQLAAAHAAAAVAATATTSPDTTTKAAQDRGAAKANTPPEQVNKYNVTDPDSRIMPTRKGWIQGYNCQLAATSDHVILAVRLTQDTGDMDQLSPMLAAAVTAAGQLAPHRPAPTRQIPANPETATPAAAFNPAEIGVALFDAGYFSDANLTTPGPDRLIAPGKHRDLHRAARQDPTQGPPPAEASAAAKMSHRLRTPEGIATYKRRGATVEPLNGHLKDRIGLRTFSMRGLRACQAELELAATTLNLLKLHRHRWKPAT